MPVQTCYSRILCKQTAPEASGRTWSKLVVQGSRVSCAWADLRFDYLAARQPTQARRCVLCWQRWP